MQKAIGISVGIINSVPGSHRAFHEGRGEIKLHFEEIIDFFQAGMRWKDVLGRGNSRSEVILIILQYSNKMMKIRFLM